MRLLRLLLTFLIIRLTSLILCQKNSGVYVDNGSNQTTVHEVLTQNQMFELEEEMLSLLDIDEKPKHVSRKMNVVKRSAPMFLMDVYKIMDKENGEIPKLTNFNDSHLDIFDIRGQNLRTIKDSNFIISLSAQNLKFPGTVKTEKVKRLWFNVSYVSRNDEILNAELKLFRSIEYNSTKRNHGAITITVYRVASARNAKGERDLVLVDSVNTTERNGWVTLNVTESLQYWVYNSDRNRGLYLRANPVDSPDHNVKLENAGIVGFGDDPTKHPFLVGYFKRSEKVKKRKVVTPYEDSDSFFEELRFQRKPAPCKRQNLYVNFEDLNWQDIILAPQGYDAYFCYGQCNFPPIPSNIFATNHAIIQSLVNLRNASIPKPCCAPTVMKKMKLIYQIDDDVFAYRNKDNMIVDACGCQ